MLAHPRVTPVLKLIGEFDSLRYTWIAREIARVKYCTLELTSQSIDWLVNGGMLYFLWEWSASLVTLLPSHHPHSLDISYASGEPLRGGHDWSQPTQRGGPTPSSSISVCTRLVEAPLPSNRRKVKLPPVYPGMVTYSPWGSPSYPPLYWCMYHPGGMVSLANKIQGCMGLTFVLYWRFSSWSPTYPFSATPSYCCYCSCLVILGQTRSGSWSDPKHETQC